MEFLRTFNFYCGWVGAIIFMALSIFRAWKYIRSGDSRENLHSMIAFGLSFISLGSLGFVQWLFSPLVDGNLFQFGSESMNFFGISYRMAIAAYPPILIVHIVASILRPIPMKGEKISCLKAYLRSNVFGYLQFKEGRQ